MVHFFFFICAPARLSLLENGGTVPVFCPCWHREIVTCETIRPLILFKDKLLIDSTVSPGRLMTGAFPSLRLLCFHAQHYRSSCSHLPMNVHWGCLNCPNRHILDNNSAAQQETPCHWKAGMQAVQVLTCFSQNCWFVLGINVAFIIVGSVISFWPPQGEKTTPSQLFQLWCNWFNVKTRVNTAIGVCLEQLCWVDLTLIPLGLKSINCTITARSFVLQVKLIKGIFLVNLPM